MRRAAWAALALCSLLCACTRLPKIGSNQCGNGVIEPPEDCDGFGVDSGAQCLPQGSVGECHLACSESAGGPSLCPSGWGCDPAGVCRRPTGEFSRREFEVGIATSLDHGDFDGDGRIDVLSTEGGSTYGVTRASFHYFDEEAELAVTRTFPHILIGPGVTEMNGDGRADVVFSDERVGVLLGRTDRTWIPETFTSYRLTGTAVRTLGVFDGDVEGTSGFLVIAAINGPPGVFIPDASNEGIPRRMGTLPRPVADLVGDPVAAHIVEGPAAPCAQPLLAMRGETSFSMLDVCALDDRGAPVWRSELVTSTIALDPPDPITAPPQVADMNADGHLDVILGAGEPQRTFVAYGDGRTLATAVPYQIALPTGDAGPPLSELPMPLAAGDLTGDGVVDFVYDGVLFLSSPSDASSMPSYEVAVVGGTGPWTVAKIADLNANGFPDVIVGSNRRPGLTFFNGTGTTVPTFFALPTSRPVQRLVIGDYDGDLIQDVVFTQGSPSDSESSVMAAFGAPFGAPLPPIPVARLDNVEQLATYREYTINHVAIASSIGEGEARQGALTLLLGSGDRVLTALYELTTFAADNRVIGSQALRVSSGRFRGTRKDDVLAIAFVDQPRNGELEFWLLPSLFDDPVGSPAQLSGSLPPEVHPVFADGTDVSLALAAADVDGDGRDEALLAMPTQDDEHCALLAYQVFSDRVELRYQTVVSEPCARLQLEPRDVDGDGRLDVAWLTGRADGSARRLSILWNDGVGNFAETRRSAIADGGVSPRAFALLPATSLRPTSLVYATSDAINLVPLDGRQPGAPAVIAEIPETDALTAADVNGDGAVDLVAAAQGNLNVLRASLEGL